MIMKTLKTSLLVLTVLLLASCKSALEKKTWKEGILVDEFIYDKAPYPSCHAVTIVEATNGDLVSSWFGGTHERHPDVCIYVSRKPKGSDKWTEGIMVADGVMKDGPRLPTWNPVLYQVPGGDLLLFYKIGPKPSDWKGWVISSKDDGLTWSKPKALPKDIIGPVKNKPVLVTNKRLISPSSTEGSGGKLHFEVSDDFGKTWRKV